MNQRFCPLPAAFLVAALLLGACTATADPMASAVPEDAQAQAEMMAKFMQLAQPGEHHAHLEPMVGRFRAQTKMWMDPSAPPEVSNGSVENRWILGGRFLEGRFEGQAMGMPFEGRGLIGYDNHSGHYVGSWVDNFGTMMLPVSQGACSDNGRRIELTREGLDPMTGLMTRWRDVTTIHDANRHTWEMFTQLPGQPEYRNMLIEYVRIEG